MDDRSITKLAFVVAIIGIAGIFAVVNLLEPSEMSIAEIDSSNAGDIVTITGDVSRTGESAGTYFFTITNGGSIKTVVFASTAPKIPEIDEISKNDRVEVTGQVALYKGELEIIVHALNVLSS